MNQPIRPTARRLSSASEGSGRTLSNEFLDICLDGFLKPLLDRVLRDATLEIGIRAEVLDIYYRGGRLASLSRKADGRVLASMDERYLRSGFSAVTFPFSLCESDTVAVFLNALPLLKQEIDLKEGSKDEREFQQLVMRENNRSSIANDTDYLICDLEYAPIGSPLRLDMVAAHWPSDSVVHRRVDPMGLSIIEMKYGDDALGSNNKSAGLLKHFEDMLAFAPCLQSLSKEMEGVMRQRAKLGFLGADLTQDKKASKITFKEPTPQNVEWILLLANHDPASATLQNEVIKLQERIAKVRELPFQVKIAVSTFMGYGLFDQGVMPLDLFLERFADQIKRT